MGQTMKFGMVLLTYLFSEQRREIAERSYKSLAASKVDLPLYIVAKDERSAAVAVGILSGKGVKQLICHVQPPEVGAGADAPLAWIVEQFFAETDCTHVIELADDMLYHPKWFEELQALVERHPDGTAWSVYRSAHTRHHRTLRLEGTDHLVTSLAGNGTCWTREEWVAWGVKWQHGPSWPLPDGNGNTLDLHHAYFRPGYRWATSKSYMQHIGTVGVHTQPGVPEYALNFQGEGAEG